MSMINDYAGFPLIWQQLASNQRGFELVSDAGDLLAELTQPKRHSNAATAVSDDDKWLLERTQRQFSIAHYTDEYPRNFPIKPDGTTEFELNGTVYRWSPENLWRTHWRLENDQHTLLEFRILTGFMKTTGEMCVGMNAQNDPNLPLLALIGWYLLINDGDVVGKIVGTF